MKSIRLVWWAFGILALSCDGKLDLGPQMGVIGGAPGVGGSYVGVAGATQESGGARATGGELGVSGAFPVGVGGSGSGGFGEIPGSGGFDFGGASPTGGQPGDVLNGPGTIGKPCIPGGLNLEAQGTTAQAEVRSLDHCYDGLVCTSAKVCALPPPCSGVPQVECFVYSARVSRGRDLGGAGNLPLRDQGQAGAPNSSETTGYVPALTADANNLYWVDYGTRDQLGNYNNDGSLKAYSFASGVTTTIATQLTGPAALGVTSTHVLVFVDGAPLSGASGHRKLLRIPLAGGQTELVQDNSLAITGFAAIGSTAYWVDYGFGNPASAKSLAQGVTQPATIAASTTQFISDGQDIYFGSTVAPYGTFRIPGGAGVPEAIVAESYNQSLAVGGNFLYTAEPINGGIMLDRAPTMLGGVWQRFRAAGGGSSPLRVELVGDRYFIDALGPDVFFGWIGVTGILTGSLSSATPPTRLVQRLRGLYSEGDSRFGTPPPSFPWVGTDKAIYWTNGDTIFRVPLPPL